MAVFEKGNAVIGQSGGPTCAINATLAGVISGCLASEKIETVFGMRNGVEGLLRKDLITINDYFKSSDDKKLEVLSATPGCALGSCRRKVKTEEDIENILKVLEEYNIRYFFYIGGNDSMDAVSKLTSYANSHPDAYKVNFIGVPKTIDNDLVLTDHTPGFGSAAKYIAVSMQEIMRDVAVYTTKAVTIVEIMGRDAGWLTASSAITNEICGTGPNLIYLPEYAFDKEKFILDINKHLEKNNYVVVAVSEGITDADGNYVAEDAMSGIADSFGHKYLAGTGKYLEELVRDKIGCKVRSVELNILQRCASHIASKTDIEESMKIGREAVNFSANGATGKMAVFNRVADGKDYVCEIGVEDVTQIANMIKKVPDEFIDVENSTVNKKCVDYILPLIQGEYPSKYENGLPVHFVF